MTEENKEQSKMPSAYECGRRAALAGCWRVLADGSRQETKEWLRGFDEASAEKRASKERQ